MTGTRQPTDPPTPGGPGPGDEGKAPSRRRQLTPEQALLMEEKVRKVEVAISLVLRIGVVLSVAVIAVGLGLMFAHHPDYVAITGRFGYRHLTSRGAPFPHSFAALGRAIGAGEGRGIIVLGVLILILTPVLRVAVGVLAFIYEKDPPMTIVTLYVLIVLVGSFFLAGV
ncbi:DUF1634 domain-containing protein [Acidimicrobiaceae bacterium USS-CC1]|uniref:DUF1634 domain-containing protein n=1 Tax=Acidiferrimicrobium australe TaxID=2664430 RepID=A0ABW9QSG4_9ACTN|nr:DUF1634 domain-containing protein [Acidiferrimicrobium australe]